MHPAHLHQSYERFDKVMNLQMTQAICARRRAIGVLKEPHHISGGDLARGGYHPTLNVTLTRARALSPSLPLYSYCKS